MSNFPISDDEDELVGLVRQLKQDWADRISDQSEVQAIRTLDELATIFRGFMGEQADTTFGALLLRDVRQSALRIYYETHPRTMMA